MVWVDRCEVLASFQAFLSDKVARDLAVEFPLNTLLSTYWL